ncbi:hypothetical protein SRABI128_05322 [Microbacterium sp. Bi128]|nr:hypothetical protein SRABI128_05322 [Microbacterium sp. Bi128]
MKAPIPGRSESRTSSDTRPRSRAPSAGAKRRTTRIASSESGTLIRNNACQPTRLTSRPPTTGPTAAADVFAIWIRPSGRVDFTFASRASAATMTTALGYAVAVPRAMNARATQSSAKLGAKGASAQVTATRAMPSRNSRRGPKRSASRPISGWPAAEVR